MFIYGKLPRLRRLIFTGRIQASLEHCNEYFLPGILECEGFEEPEYTVAIDDSFWIPYCRLCDGLLKPDVVFFGESVPPLKVTKAYDAVSGSRGMLILGSSVMVYSSYRFVRFAYDMGLPIASINIGTTRVEDWLNLRINEPLNEVMGNLYVAIGTNAR